MSNGAHTDMPAERAFLTFVAIDEHGKQLYDDIAHANTKADRDLLQTAVLNAYTAAVAQAKASAATQS